MTKGPNTRIDGEKPSYVGYPPGSIIRIANQLPTGYNQESAVAVAVPTADKQPISRSGTYLIIDENGNRLPDTGVPASRIVMLTFNAGEFVRVSPTAIGRVMTVGFKNHEEYCWVCIKHDGPDQFVRCLASQLGKVSLREVEEQLARGYGG